MKILREKPSVSVIIPLFNHEGYIDAALDSVLGQTCQPDQIIVVDDGSTDSSWERVAQRASRESRMIVWSHSNRGAAHTLNAALAKATGDYVAILNSDDRYHPERLEACVQCLENDPKAHAVFSRLRFIDGKDVERQNKWYERALNFYRKNGDLSLSLVNGNFLMTTSNLFIRRHVIEDMGGFANLRYAHDLDFFLRFLAAGFNPVLLEDPLLYYRMHASNTIDEGVLKVKLEWAAVVAFYVRQIGGNLGWEYLRRLMEITDRHNLTRLMFFFFARFSCSESDQDSVDAWLGDKSFVSFMSGVVR
jgi:glycosyltransferase involved in cell wall biosynthesis